MKQTKLILSKRSFQHGYALLVLLTVPTIFLRHLLVHPTSSYGLPNTDTEGTMWWIWTQCKGYGDTQILNRVSLPLGFDVSHLPVFNLVDSIRVLYTKANHCSIDSVVSSISLFPLIAIWSTAIAAYFLGLQLFSKKLPALVVAFSAAFSSQVLLATRTSLANNLLAPGLLAIGFVIVFIRTRNKWAASLSIVLISIQTLCNVYNGALFCFLAISFTIFLVANRAFDLRLKIKLSFLLISAAVVGLIPLIKSQFFLYTDPTQQAIYRPVEVSDEVVNPLVLFSRNYQWFNSRMPSFFPRPESGWLSLFHLITILFLICAFVRFKKIDASQLRMTLMSSCTAFFLILIIYDLPGTSLLKKLYFSILFPLRGVGNFSKGIPLLLGISGVALILLPNFLSKTQTPNSRRSGITNFLLWCALPLLLIDNVPRDSSFYEKTSLTSTIKFWRQIKSQTPEVTAHFPDFNYGPDWGLPSRSIQISQMLLDDSLLNGRYFKHRGSICTSLPTPMNSESFQVLLNRGVSRIIFHRNLMVPSELRTATTFLESVGMKGQKFVENQGQVQKLNRENLDVEVFIIPPNLRVHPKC